MKIKKYLIPLVVNDVRKKKAYRRKKAECQHAALPSLVVAQAIILVFEASRTESVITIPNAEGAPAKI